MAEFFPYLINVSICSSVLYAFYYLALRNLTFFMANRAFLISSLVISLVIPLLNISLFYLPNNSTSTILKNVALPNYISDDFSFSEVSHHHYSFLQVLSIAYFIGGIFMIIRFSFYMVLIIRLVYLNKNIKSHNIKLVENAENHVSFSFFHYVFIDPMKIREAGSSYQIIEHEKVHARELHSIDLIFVELVCVLLWFNPFVFFYRNSIKMTHEYIADSKVIKSGIHKIDYLSTLANEVFKNHNVGLTSSFNYSITKKRLAMITKINSSKKAGLKFLFVLPLVAILLVGFSKSNKNNRLTLNKSNTLDSISQINELPSIMPINKKDVETTSGYGMRVHPIYKIKQLHKGIDFKAAIGTTIVATANGIVESVETKKEEGNYLIIRHNDHFETLYSHLSDFKVKSGDHVTQGQTIGHVGNTGLSTGSHLHYEVIKDGVNVDPKDYIK